MSCYYIVKSKKALQKGEKRKARELGKIASLIAIVGELIVGLGVGILSLNCIRNGICVLY